ncbi:mcak-like kinesin, putative [Leishmania tarentolae]|uniref:Kinesin-like protein n=1 Tax=Leishmania tarentolae TaxID=5689 RepID=A0A640KGK3_LEITA|nr:mcak-like kinesin, putative [Leishmania tarentolae]
MREDSPSNESQSRQSERTCNVSPGGPGPSPSIVVAVRKRPRIPGREDDENDVVRCGENGGPSVTVYEPRTKLDLTPIIEPSSFSYDHVFGEACTNEEVYRGCCQPLLQNVREGGGAVIFAFGQTGSGKTHTMLGTGERPGLYSLAVTELLTMTEHSTFTASFYEVYGAKLYDLLNDRAEVKMLQDEYQNVHIVGITEQVVSSVDDVNALMMRGQQLRAIGTTHANDRSSRSHAVLEIKLKLADSSSESQLGRITFVDLAGSERASDTAETDAKTRREGAEINKSLLALKECIRAMSMRKRHIPFRGSKLTQILRESFVGRCKTCVIAAISPCQSHCEDTLNTLRYADRIKELKGPANPHNGVKPIPCKTCGQPIFIGDRHVCKRQVVTCPHCRQEVEKQELDAHVAECRESPIRCQYCNERVLRGEMVGHIRRCSRAPIRCGACGTTVPRQLMDKHTQQECTEIKVKCRYCGCVQSRQVLTAHEQSCDAAKVACPHCLQFVRKRRLDRHLANCVRNPSRALHAPRSAAVNIVSSASMETSQTLASSTSSMGVQQSIAKDVTAQTIGSSRASSLHNHNVAAELMSVHADLMTADEGTGTLKFTGAHSSRKSSAQLASDLSFVDRSESHRAPMAGGRWNAGALGADEGNTMCNNDCGSVVCPYSRYGCPVKVTRLNVAAHLKESIQQHLELVTTYADRVDEQNMQLRRLVIHEADTLSSCAMMERLEK